MRNPPSIPRRAARVGTLFVTGFFAIALLPVQAQKGMMAPRAFATNTRPDAVVTAPAPATDPKADKAWRAVEKAGKAEPLPPIGFVLKGIFGAAGPADVRNFLGKNAIPDEIKTADKAADFALHFPNDPRVLAALVVEYEHLAQAGRYMRDLSLMEAGLKAKGQLPDPRKFSFTNVLPRQIALEKECLSNKNLSDDDRFFFRNNQVFRLLDGPPDQLADAAMSLQREFPEKSSPYQTLRLALENMNADKARALAAEIVDSAAPEKEKLPFKGVLHRLDSMGTNVTFRFTALDGREVDTAKMKGKVVLVAFWATWCAPCVAEIPALQAAYDKFHTQGLEIVGISLDDQDDKDKLVKFLKAKKIPWPQYFDGKEYDNQMAVQFGINSIPALFLIDKQGVLRDTKAASGLEDKIGNLLSEP
jgi:thiol-disulfide isomerase/thioredoxin